jgi:hypothetical protein
VALVERAGEFAHLTDGVKKENYYDDDFVYLHGTWLFQAVQTFAEQQGFASAVVSVPHLKEVLKNEKALECKREGGKNRYAQKLPNSGKIGDERRFLKVPKAKILSDFET